MSTGSGKVAGVKLEIDDEKWAGGAEGIRLRQGFRLRKASARQEAEKLLCGARAGLRVCSTIFEMSLHGTKGWDGAWGVVLRRD
jgi:hypothetical protein